MNICTRWFNLTELKYIVGIFNSVNISLENYKSRYALLTIVW